MKWVLSQQSLDHHRWLLQDANEEAQFTYNLQHHSIRIKGKSNRLFFLKVAGLFQKKVQLLTEYGIVLGETQRLPDAMEGTISLHQEKLFYAWADKQLAVFSNDKNELFSAAIGSGSLPSTLEKLALVFTSIWLVKTDLLSGRKEDMLVA